MTTITVTDAACQNLYEAQGDQQTSVRRKDKDPKPWRSRTITTCCGCGEIVERVKKIGCTII